MASTDIDRPAVPAPAHLRSDAELIRAIAIIDSLISRGDLDSGEQDYLDVLTDIVEKYEAEEHPMPSASDADMLRLLLEDREMTEETEPN